MENEREPYVGPRPFERKDANIFFGRNQIANELVSLILAHPVALIYAQSGAGKTSLIKARVIPMLDDDEEFDILPVARVRSQHSSDVDGDSIRNIYIYNAIQHLSSDEGQSSDLSERAAMRLSEYLKQRPRAFKKQTGQLVADGLDHRERRLPRALIFDQFEELFKFYPERFSDRNDFFEQVNEALEEDPYLRVVFSMREDYIAELDPYVNMLPEKLRTRFRMERLNKDTALAAVKGPLETKPAKDGTSGDDDEAAVPNKAYSLRFADGVAEKLVENLLAIRVPGSPKMATGQYVEAVQLQIVCQTLWHKVRAEGHRIITYQHLAEFGDVNRSLSEFYEKGLKKALAAAREEQKDLRESVLRRWFDRVLITPEGARNTIRRGKETTAGIPNAAIDVLEGESLLRSELRDNQIWYELSHDRLIPPIQEAYKKWLLEQPGDELTVLAFEERAEKWVASQRRDESLLFNSGELIIARRWIDSQANTANYSEGFFALVQASEAAVNELERKRMSALADEQQLRAEAELQRANALAQSAKEQQHRARQLKYGLTLVCALLLLMVAVAVYALERSNEANKQKTEADTQRRIAEKARSDAEDANIKITKLLGITKAEKRKAEEAQSVATKEKQKAIEAKEATVAALKQAQLAKDEADKQRREAVAQREFARAAAAQASHAAEIAKRSEVVAKASEQQAFVNQLTAQSVSVSRQQAHSLGNSVLLATEALRLSHSPQSSLPSYQMLSEGLALLPLPLAPLERQGNVSGVAFSPDGKSLLTVGNDVRIAEDGTKQIAPGALWMWDAVSGKEIKTEPFASTGLAVAQSSERKYFVTRDNVSDLFSVWNWDETGIHKMRELHFSAPVSYIYKNKSATPAPFAISTGGKYVATLRLEQSKGAANLSKPSRLPVAERKTSYYVSVLNAESGKEIKLAHDEPVKVIAFSPKGETLATADDDGAVRVWKFNAGPLTPKLLDAPHATSLTFSKDGEVLAVGDTDGGVRVINWQQDDTVAVVRHEDKVSAVAFSDDGKFLATASNDGTGRVWDLTNLPAREVARVVEEKSVNSIAFSSDGKYIATVTDDGARAWEVPGRPGSMVIKLGDVQSYARSYNDEFVAIDDGEDIHVWKQSTGELSSTIPLGSTDIHNISVSDDGKVVAGIKFDVNTYEDLLLVWNASSPQTPKELSFTSNVDRVLVSPDGKRVGVQRTDNVVELVELASGNKSVLPQCGSAPLTSSVAFSGDGNYFAVATQANVCVWRTSNRQLVAPAPQINGASRIALSHDGNYLVAVGLKTDKNPIGDTKISAWDLSKGQLLDIQTENYQGVVNYLAISQDGKYFAAASSDNRARVWTLPEGKLLSMMTHAERVLYAAFSKDGQFLATASGDNTVRVWKTETGCEVARINQARTENTPDEDEQQYASNDESVDPFAFISPEGKYMIVGNSKGAQMRVWRKDDLLTNVCRYVTRNLSAEEWHNKYFINKDRPLPMTCDNLPQQIDSNENEHLEACESGLLKAAAPAENPLVENPPAEETRMARPRRRKR